MHTIFGKFAHKTAQVMGSPKAFSVAVLIVLTWVITGPIFDFSNTWQLLINTFTTIATFLVVILIQHTQNHDAKALQLKLDELIRAQKRARNALVDLEAMNDEELDRLQDEFRRIREKAMKRKGGANGGA